MKEFCLEILQPRINALSPEDRLKAPNFDDALQDALQMPKDKGMQTFHRLASGRVYKGKLIDLVSDLLPELVVLCIKATTPLTDDEILLHAIDHVDDAPADERNFEHKHERLEAAKKCVAFFQSQDNGGINSNINHGVSKANGLECEHLCVEWLENQKRDDDDQIVLSNVLINNKKTKLRSKYLIRGNVRSIIWTSSARDGVCSEFDAVVLQAPVPGLNGDDETIDLEVELPTSISEIWEAKYSMGPSSLHDVLSKKLPAIRTLLEDGDLSIYYKGSHRRLVESGGPMTLGLFGMELLPPENALGQLRSTAISYALSTNVDAALHAVENGFIELGVECILDDLRRLRQKYIDSNNVFNIVVKVAA